MVGVLRANEAGASKKRLRGRTLVTRVKRLGAGTPLVIAFSPDGKTIAWATWEGPVRLCDRATGQELRQFDGHRGRVLSLVFTPDGQHLISGSADSTALVWALSK